MNTALLVGLAAAPTVSVVGAAIDLSEAHMTQTRLQRAAETAAQALRANPGLAREAREALVHEAVDAQFPNRRAGLIGLSVIEKELSDRTHRVEIQASMRTLVLRLARIESMSFKVEAEAREEAGLKPEGVGAFAGASGYAIVGAASPGALSLGGAMSLAAPPPLASRFGYAWVDRVAAPGELFGRRALVAAAGGRQG